MWKNRISTYMLMCMLILIWTLDLRKKQWLVNPNASLQMLKYQFNSAYLLLYCLLVETQEFVAYAMLENVVEQNLVKHTLWRCFIILLILIGVQIAGGSGITPMLQIVEAILKNPDDKTQVSCPFTLVPHFFPNMQCWALLLIKFIWLHI